MCDEKGQESRQEKLIYPHVVIYTIWGIQNLIDFMMMHLIHACFPRQINSIHWISGYLNSLGASDFLKNYAQIKMWSTWTKSECNANIFLSFRHILHTKKTFFKKLKKCPQIPPPPHMKYTMDQITPLLVSAIIKKWYTEGSHPVCFNNLVQRVKSSFVQPRKHSGWVGNNLILI